MEGYEGKIQKKKQNRASFLSIRLTGEELVRLREIATRYGLEPSTYARQVLIQGMESWGERTFPPDLLLRIFSEYYGSGKSQEEREECLQQLNEIYKQYSKMQGETAKNIVTSFLFRPATRSVEK